MLVFGGVSSADIYDDLAKVVLMLTIIMAAHDKRLTTQVLDDVVACGAEGDGSVSKFFNMYKLVANKIGVQVADESDPDKCFNATHEGKVLGIMYNLRTWECWIPQEKLVPILHLLKEVRDQEKINNSSMLSLLGKLNHYQWLVPEGPWQKGFLLRLQDARAPGSEQFTVTDLAREQAAWWIVHLQAATDHFTIPDLRAMESLNATEVFTDAGGGSEAKIKNGIGGITFPGTWFYLPWPPIIRENRQNSLGMRFANKLSTLEGFGALVGLTTIPDLPRNKTVILENNNSGFVHAFQRLELQSSSEENQALFRRWGKGGQRPQQGVMES